MDFDPITLKFAGSVPGIVCVNNKLEYPD